MNLTPFLQSFIDWVNQAFNFFIGFRIVVFGFNVSVFGLFIVCCVIMIICNMFLRSSKW